MALVRPFKELCLPSKRFSDKATLVIIWLTVFCGLALLATLLVLSWIDWRTHRLPNPLTYLLIALGLLWAFGTQLDFYPHLLGAALGYGAFWAIEVAYRLIRKREGLGRGDAKLLAAGGAWCGVTTLPFIILIGSVGGIIFVLARGGDRNARVPFGPFLALGIGVVWCAQRLL